MAKGVQKTSLWDGLTPESTETHTHTPTHNYTHTQPPTPKKERKTFRAQILTYPSLISQMDAYASNHGMSRAEVFERAVSEFLGRNT